MSDFREQRWSLKGMTALVTGGTKGIGFVLSLICLEFPVLIQFYSMFFVTTQVVNELIDQICSSRRTSSIWRNSSYMFP